MKITVIQSTYRRNPYIIESALLNLMALKKSKVDFQYIIFNDCGDSEIKDDIKEILDEIDYVYSDINYGKKMCAGSYIGAIQYAKGDIIHLIGQDDVFTSLFFEQSMKYFLDNPNIHFVTSNAYKVDELLHLTGIMINPEYKMDCSKPYELFKFWFGIESPQCEVTRANNGFLAPGTMYKKELNELIGPFDLEHFRGAADFEYWARILFNGYSGKYISQPNWYYRISKYSTGNELIEGKQNLGYWLKYNIEAIKQKYKTLVQQNKEKFK